MSGGMRWSAEQYAEHMRKAKPTLTVMPDGRAISHCPSVEPTRSRERNIRTVLDGITFDSKREAGRYQALKLMEQHGAVRELRVHPVYPLVVNGEHICDYEADFSYRNTAGVLVVEDVKGRKSGGPFDLFKLKAKLMKALYGIEVTIV